MDTLQMLGKKLHQTLSGNKPTETTVDSPTVDYSPKQQGKVDVINPTVDINLAEKTWREHNKSQSIQEDSFIPTENPEVESTETTNAQESDTEDSYIVHFEKLQSRIKSHAHSDYLEVLRIAETLNGHIQDEPTRLKVALQILHDTKIVFTDVDVISSINTLLDELEAYRELTKMQQGKTLAQQRYDHLVEEYDKLGKEIQKRTFDIAELEIKIKDLRELNDHDTGVRDLLWDDIQEAHSERVTNVDKATDDVKSEIIRVKTILQS